MFFANIVGEIIIIIVIDFIIVVIIIIIIAVVVDVFIFSTLDLAGLLALSFK